jgi:transposase
MFAKCCVSLPCGIAVRYSFFMRTKGNQANGCRRCAELEARLAAAESELARNRKHAERSAELIITQQRELSEARQQIRTLEEALDEARKKLGASPTTKLDEPFSMKAEDKRQKARGRKTKKNKNKPRRKGRVFTADKLAMAEHEENVFPDGVDPHQCERSHSRPVWRLIDGRAVLVAYHMYRGPRSEYGEIPGTLGRSEFGLEIIVAISYLVYIMGLSFDQVCRVMQFFQGLPLKKSQVDALLHQLARHWQKEFDRLCILLAHSAVVHADETSWSINSVWAFISEKARLFWFGVPRDADTLKQILDAATFAGILISDDAAVYANFSHAQKCWAHLLRKAIRLTLQSPDNADYRRLVDGLLDIYRRACRVQQDGRLCNDGRARKVGVLEDELLDLCASVCSPDMSSRGPENDCRLLCNELMRLSLESELFTFVTAAAVETPLGTERVVPGTNNDLERELRTPSKARYTGRTNKTTRGARRRTIVTSVLESLRDYLSVYTLSRVVEEVAHWSSRGRSCFAELLERLGLEPSDESILDTLLPVPGD